MTDTARETATLIEPRFTYDDLLHMPDDGKRYEIIDGELYVSPSPVVKHQVAVGNIYVFVRAAQDAGFGRAFIAPLDVVFDRDNVTEPDVLFVGNERLSVIREANLQGAPDLVVEVLSPSTRNRDVGPKLRVYARFLVRFYWLVDPETRTVQPYTLTAGGYVPGPTLGVEDTIAFPLAPQITIRVGKVFE